MKNRFLVGFMFLVTLLAQPVSAQWKVGVQAGLTSNHLTAHSGYAYDRVYELEPGVTIGVPVRYEFVDWFALQAEISYMQKNYSFSRANSYELYNGEVRNDYMELPLFARFSFGGEKLRGFLNTGAYFGYWMSSHLQMGLDQTFDYDNSHLIYSDGKVPFDSRRDNRFDGGLVGGIGLQYQLTPRVQLVAEGRYYLGLTDLQKEYMLKQYHRYNNTFVFQIGCMFTLGD